MKEFDLNEAYDTLVKSSGEKVETDAADSDRRLHPRFEVTAGSVKLLLEPRVFVINVSVSGVAFECRVAFDKGQVITIAMPEFFTVEAEVVGCEIVETDAAMMEARYRVQCRFLQEDLGMQLLVMLKEFESLHDQENPDQG